MRHGVHAVIVLLLAGAISAVAVGCGPKPPQPMSAEIPSGAPPPPPAAAPAPAAESVEVAAPKLDTTPPTPPAKAPPAVAEPTQPALPKPAPAPKVQPKPAAAKSAPPKPAPAKATPVPAKAEPQDTVVNGTIEVVSNIPDPSTLPYDTCVTFIKYKVSKVVSGSYAGGELLAVFWGLRKGKLQPAASFRVGQSHRLTIEPFSEHADLARVMQADDTNEYSLTPYWVVSYTAE